MRGSWLGGVGVPLIHTVMAWMGWVLRLDDR